MTSPDHALSFGAAAEAYDRARPGYPDDVVEWLLDGVDGPVADVGAGTGKLTASLAARRPEVVAVEPDDAMRGVLTARFPHVRAYAGSAEHVPLADDSLALVTMGQAWHWVEVGAASRELGRVLGRPGRLGLVWNYRDDTDPWVVRLGHALGGVDSAGRMDDVRRDGPDLTAPFRTPERLETPWEHVVDVDTLVALAASRSYVIVRPDDERRRILDAVRSLGEERAEPDGTVRLPYRTYAFRCDLAPVDA